MAYLPIPIPGTRTGRGRFSSTIDSNIGRQYIPDHAGREMVEQDALGISCVRDGRQCQEGVSGRAEAFKNPPVIGGCNRLTPSARFGAIRAFTNRLQLCNRENSLAAVSTGIGYLFVFNLVIRFGDEP